MKDGFIFLVMLSPNINNSNFLLPGCFLSNSFVGVSSQCIIFPFFPTVSHGFLLSLNGSKVFKISLSDVVRVKFVTPLITKIMP